MSGLNVDRRELAGIRRAIDVAHDVGHPQPQARSGAGRGVLPSASTKATWDLRTQSSRGGVGADPRAPHTRTGTTTRQMRSRQALDSWPVILRGRACFEVDRLYICDAVKTPDYRRSFPMVLLVLLVLALFVMQTLLPGRFREARRRRRQGEARRKSRQSRPRPPADRRRSARRARAREHAGSAAGIPGARAHEHDRGHRGWHGDHGRDDLPDRADRVRRRLPVRRRRWCVRSRGWWAGWVSR